MQSVTCGLRPGKRLRTVVYCRWEGEAGGTAGGSDASRGLLSDVLVETRQAGDLKPGDGSELQKHLQEARGRSNVSPGTLTFKQGNPVLADPVRDQGSVQLAGFSAAGTLGRRDTAHGGRIQQTLPLARRSLCPKQSLSWLPGLAAEIPADSCWMKASGWERVWTRTLGGEMTKHLERTRPRQHTPATLGLTLSTNCSSFCQTQGTLPRALAHSLPTETALQVQPTLAGRF